VYGNQTDLGDYYRGALSLRQIRVRIQCLPDDAPLIAMLSEREQSMRERAEHDLAMSPFDQTRKR
jgi:hypothetical protein